jgi:hypothetical protein
VVLDTPGQVSQLTLDIARHADLIVQPTGPSADDLLPAMLVFQAMTNLGIAPERMIFALCRTLSDEEEPRGLLPSDDVGVCRPARRDSKRTSTTAERKIAGHR